MSFQAQGMVHKCQNCYALRQPGKPKFKGCPQCKAARYCSKECQKADWERHKTTCKANAEYGKNLEAIDNTSLGRMHAALLPDNMTFYQLDQLLEAWVHVHMRMLMVACIHAIRLPDGYDRLRTHVLTVQLRPLPRSVHGGNPARAFAVVDAFPLTVAEGARRGDAWRHCIEQLRTMQVLEDKVGTGRMGAAMLECPPLAVQVVPFGSIRPARGRVQENWKDIFVEDIQEGRPATRLTVI